MWVKLRLESSYPGCPAAEITTTRPLRPTITMALTSLPESFAVGCPGRVRRSGRIAQTRSSRQNSTCAAVGAVRSPN